MLSRYYIYIFMFWDARGSFCAVHCLKAKIGSRLRCNISLEYQDRKMVTKEKAPGF